MIFIKLVYLSNGQYTLLQNVTFAGWKLRRSSLFSGVLYGLPKIHKQNCPIRPIVSAVGCFNHKVARFLVDVLSPLITNQYTIKDSFSFVDELRELSCGKDVFMCSFDVTSLFTNIPLRLSVFVQMPLLIKPLPLQSVPTSWRTYLNFARRSLYSCTIRGCTNRLTARPWARHSVQH